MCGLIFAGVRIAVNTRLLIPQKLEGIGWFTREIFYRLVRTHPEVEWLFLFDRPVHPQLALPEGVQVEVLPPPTRHPVLWYLWFEHRLPRFLKRKKVDLLISPDGFAPLKGSVPALPVIHDLNFEHQPQNVPWLTGRYLRYFFPRIARQSRHLATVSEFSRQDLHQTYGVPLPKISVVPNGVGAHFQPSTAEAIQAYRQKHTAGKPFFIFIGALNPRKNLEGLLSSYQLYRERGYQAHLLIVGEVMFGAGPLKRQYRHHPFRADIHFTGRLEGSQLREALAAAQALWFVSHYEGFGIPIIEAFRCGVPVITAQNSSMPEIAGEAAWCCPSHDTKAIAEAMIQSEDPGQRARRIKAGRERAECFTWERAAQCMWEAIQKALAP